MLRLCLRAEDLGAAEALCEALLLMPRLRALALRVTNLGLIAAVTGALVSTSIGYILPSLMPVRRAGGEAAGSAR